MAESSTGDGSGSEKSNAGDGHQRLSMATGGDGNRDGKEKAVGPSSSNGRGREPAAKSTASDGGGMEKSSSGDGDGGGK